MCQVPAASGKARTRVRVQRARPHPGLAGVLLQFLLCPVSRSTGACALCSPAQVGQGPGQIATCQHAVLSGGLAEVSGGCATTGAKFLLQSWGPEHLMDQVLLGHRPGPGIRSEFTLMGFISGSGEPPSPVWAALSQAWWAVRARGMRAEETGIWCLGWRPGWAAAEGRALLASVLWSPSGGLAVSPTQLQHFSPITRLCRLGCWLGPEP